MQADTPPTIAVVDDDEINRSMLCDMVRSFGWTGVGYGTAELFLSEQLMRSADCWVIDLLMPGMTGLKTLHAFRSAGVAKPVIVITSDYEAKMIENLRVAGVFKAVAKPVNPHELRLAIERAVVTTAVSF